MAIYGISDLHLSLTEPFSCTEPCHERKPMSVFGAHWQDHCQKIFRAWKKIVKEEDTVLVPGDLSWAMRLDEAVYDFAYLSQLPGRLLICRGNHDYWWDTKAKIIKALPPNVIPLQNESVVAEDVVVSATRGWVCPGGKDFGAEDEKIYRRELIRLEMALRHGQELRAASKKPLDHWVMLHYRPVNDAFDSSGFVELMRRYGVSRCFYGHLHGDPCYHVLEGERFGLEFQLLSCDYLQFQPLRLK